MPDLFGVAGGQQQAVQDSDTHALRQLALTEGGIKIESDKIALKQAELMLKMQEQVTQRMAHMNSGGPGAGAGTPGAPMEDQAKSLANDYMELARITEAFPEQSAKYAEAANNISKGQAYIAEKYYKRQIDDMQFASNLMGGVHDDKSFKQAALAAITERPEMAQMYGGILGKILTGEMSYSPQNVEMIKKAAVKVKDQATMSLDESRKAEADKRAEYLGHEEKRADAEARAADALTEYRKQHGVNDPTKPPTAAQTNAVVGLINEKYSIPGIDPSVIRRRALPIAQRTAELMNGGMNLDDASRVAFREAEKGGSFRGMTKQPLGRGASVANPSPLPSKPDPKLLKEGSFYRDGEEVRQFMGLDAKGKAIWGEPEDTSPVGRADDDDEEEQDPEDRAFESGFPNPDDEPARERR